MDCNLIKFKSSYLKQLSPPPQQNEKLLKVFISMDILLISKVDEIGQIFSVQFRMSAKWKDTRLTFLNLKRNVNLNVLELDDQQKIWTPVIIFKNTLHSDQSLIDHK